LLTTAYHPQINGMVECVHRQIKDALRALGAGPLWNSWVLFGLHAAPKEDSAVSSAELVTGAPLILPGQLLHVPDPPCVDVPPLPTQLAAGSWHWLQVPCQLTWAEQNTCTSVLAASRSHWQPQMPAKGAKSSTILVGQRQVISVDRLKAHTGSSRGRFSQPSSQEASSSSDPVCDWGEGGACGGLVETYYLFVVCVLLWRQ
jgi:hypothetical protein